MSKFCTSCGAQLGDDQSFCTSCGAKQDAAAQQPAQGGSGFAQAAGSFAQNATDTVKQTFDGVTFDSVKGAMTMDNIKNVGKTKNKNTIIGLCAIAVAVVLIIIICASLFGGHPYEKPLDNYFKAIEKGDGKALMKSMPDYINESTEEMIEEWYDDEYDDLEEYYDEQLKELLDEFEDEYGDNIKIKYKVKSKEKIKDKKLSDLEDTIEELYDEKVDVSKGYELKLKVTIKGKDDDDEETARIKVYKIDGKWCITGDIF